MKKFKYLIGLGILLTGLVIFFACEDRLDKLPLGDTESTFFTTEDNYESAIRGMYAGLTYWYWYNNNSAICDLWLLPGDDLTTKQTRSFESFNSLTPDAYSINYFWDMTYAINMRANIMLEKIDQVADGVYIDADLKNWHKGEALFIRALAFYKLWSWFGTAPLVTTRITGLGEETKPPSSTGTQMLDQAITDLTEAATLLPVSWIDQLKGRATADAAYGLLGKCLVTRACYGGGAADYNAAITAFNNISEADLAPHFGSNFDAWDENNIESLFEFQASEAPAFDNIWLSNDFGSIGSMLAFYGYFNNAWTWWGQPSFVPTDKLVAAFETGDPRINETFRPNEAAVFNGWEFLKYTLRDDPNSAFGCSRNNTRILRYGDILLLRAEAYLQTGNTAAALEDINAIRERARNSVPDTDPVSAVPADLVTVTMQDIMDERFRELSGEEGIRFLDLKRWHEAGYINLGTWTDIDDWGPSLNTLSFDFAGWYSDTEGQMLYPIPLDEVDLNPNITQNPGY